MIRVGRRSLFCLGLVVTALATAPSAFGQGLTRGPYLQLGNTDGAQAVVVSWFTDKRSDSVVEYGTDGDYRFVVEQDERVRHHIVTLERLSPDSEYQYRIRSDDSTLADSAFRTWPVEPRPFRFAALGDTGSGRTPQFEIAEQVAAAEPDFIVLLGDVVYDTGQDEDYPRKFYAPYSDLISRLILLPTMGNHDMRTDRGEAFLENFILPDGQVDVPEVRPEENYSFDYGSAHFVTVNTSISLDDDERIELLRLKVAPWLRDDLMRSSKPWKIVFLHHPPYSSGRHGDTSWLQEILVPILEEAGVDLVLSGHDHNYERLLPLLEGDVVDDFDQGAVQYVVSGSGGQSVRDADSTAKTAALYDKDYSATLVDISGTELTITQIDRKGRTVDRFTRSKRPFSSYETWIGARSATLYRFERDWTQIGYARLESSSEESRVQGHAFVSNGREDDPISITSIAAQVPSLSWSVVLASPHEGDVSLSVANVGSGPADLNASLIDLDGELIEERGLELGRGEQQFFHVQQLFSGFRSDVVGRVSLRANQPISVAAIKSIVTNFGVEYSSLPTRGSGPISEEQLPFLPTGGGVESFVFLVNDTTSVSIGNLVLRRQSPPEALPIALSIPAGGTRVFAVNSLGDGIWRAEWDRVTGERPALSGVLEHSSAGVRRQLGLVPRKPVEGLLLPIARKPGRAISLAVHNVSAAASDVQVVLRTTGGTSVGNEQIALAAGQTVATFLADLFEDLPIHFEGILEVNGSSPFLFEAFMSVDTTRGLLLTAWAEFEPDRQEGGVGLVLPLVAVGEDLRTNLQLVNFESGTARIKIRLRKEKDQGLRVFLNY